MKKAGKKIESVYLPAFFMSWNFTKYKLPPNHWLM